LASLFNDLIEANGKAVVSTRDEPEGSRYTMSDPDGAWRTMSTMWTSAAIKPARIVHDIDKVRTALVKIIAAEGTIVGELDNRNGHRKVAARLVRTMHPECVAAMARQCASWLGLSGPRAEPEEEEEEEEEV
jgi:hypothetical protein